MNASELSPAASLPSPRLNSFRRSGALRLQVMGRERRALLGTKRMPAGERPMRSPTGRDYSAQEQAMAQEMLQKLQRGEDLRTDIVTRARDVLAQGGYAGAYETDFALDIVAERLLEELS